MTEQCLVKKSFPSEKNVFDFHATFVAKGLQRMAFKDPSLLSAGAGFLPSRVCSRYTYSYTCNMYIYIYICIDLGCGGEPPTLTNFHSMLVSSFTQFRWKKSPAQHTEFDRPNFFWVGLDNMCPSSSTMEAGSEGSMLFKRFGNRNWIFSCWGGNP